MGEPVSSAPYATPGALERVETRARDDRVTLQKQIEREIAYVRELIDQRIALHQEAMELRITLEQKALELASAETARRLDVLNHAHAAAVDAQARTVPREVFEGYTKSMSEALEIARKEQQLWKDSVNQAITQSQTSSKTWMVAIGLLVTLVSLALRYIGPS